MHAAIVPFFLLVLAFGIWLFVHNRTLRHTPSAMPVWRKAETLCGFAFYLTLATLIAWSLMPQAFGVNTLGVQWITVAFGTLYLIPPALGLIRQDTARVSAR